MHVLSDLIFLIVNNTLILSLICLKRENLRRFKFTLCEYISCPSLSLNSPWISKAAQPLRNSSLSKNLKREKKKIGNIKIQGGEAGTEKAGRMLSLPLSYRLTDKNIRIFRIMIIIRILIIITPFIKLKGENLLPIDFCGQTGYS